MDHTVQGSLARIETSPSNQNYVRANLAASAINLFSPLIRESLLSDANFVGGYGLDYEALISFGGSDVTFSRVPFFDTLRSSFDPSHEPAAVNDTEGRLWTLGLRSVSGRAILAITNGDRHLVVPYAELFHPDPDVRLKALHREAEELNLPVAAVKHWEGLLAKDPLQDHELDGFQDDLNDTPVAARALIDHALRTGASIPDIVPRSLRYYERLVGSCDTSMNFDTFVEEVAAPHMARLVAWNPEKGFRHSLLLGSHPKLAACLPSLGLTSEQLAKIYLELCENGTPPITHRDRLWRTCRRRSLCH